MGLHLVQSTTASSPGSSAGSSAGPSLYAAPGKRALLLVNPRSRRGSDQNNGLVEMLGQRGLDVQVASPEYRWGIRETIREHAGRCDMILLAGGDGTLHLAAGALVQSGLPLGVIPMGTANDLAASLGIPEDIEKACDVIAAGHLSAIDLGWVNGSYFFNAANIGFAVDLTRRLSSTTKKRWGAAGYGVAAIDALRTRRAFDAEIHCMGQTHHVRSMQISVGNGRYHGGSITTAGHAFIDDHQLHLYSVQPVSLWQLVGLIPALLRGEQRSAAHVDTLDARELEIRTAHPMRIIADGEFTTHTPAAFRVVPEALSVFTPEMPKGPGLAAK